MDWFSHNIYWSNQITAKITTPAHEIQVYFHTGSEYPKTVELAHDWKPLPHTIPPTQHPYFQSKSYKQASLAEIQNWSWKSDL